MAELLRGYSLSCRGVIVRAVLLYHAAVLQSIMRAWLQSIMPRCYSLSCRRFCFIMPRGVVILNHAARFLIIMPAVYIIMPRCLLPIRKRVHGSGSRSYCLSFRAVLNHHAARVYIIMPAVQCPWNYIFCHKLNN